MRACICKETGTVCQRRAIMAGVARIRCDEADGASPLYQLATDFTQAWASVFVAKPLVGQSGRYLQVRNRASEKGLSLLTRGRL